MSLLFKKIISSLILVAFLSLTFFSFVIMMHGQDGRMQGDCPFSAVGTSLCPQDTLAVVSHHISAYQSFFNIPLSPNITVSILLLLLVTSAIFILLISSPLLGSSVFVGYVSNFLPVFPNTRKIIRWLSLLENSPSFS